MLKTLTLMLLGASALAAQKLPQIAEGTWKFTISQSYSSSQTPWTALIQVQQSAAIMGTFTTGTGARFPGFTGTISPSSSATSPFATVRFTWDSTNRDVPGVLVPTAGGGSFTCVYDGIVTPDGATMSGSYRPDFGGTASGTWTASFIPPSVPVVSIVPTSPTVAACTATVQNMDAGTILLSGFRCLITPPSGAASLQFAGDAGTAVVTGSFQEPATQTIAAASIRR